MTKAQKIEKSLRKQLELKGANEYHFQKLIDDYCGLYEMLEKLKQDVKDRGVTVTTFNSKGDEIEKTNPSIAEAVKVSTQMIRILDKLQISPKDNMSGDDDEL